MIRTFDADDLKKRLKVGETKSWRGYCQPEEIERLKKEGFKVENFDLGIEEVEITRIL